MYYIVNILCFRVRNWTPMIRCNPLRAPGCSLQGWPRAHDHKDHPFGWPQ